MRQTLGIYARQVRFLLPVGLIAGVPLALDGLHDRRSPAAGIALLLLNTFPFTLFVALVVLLVADVRDGGTRRGLGDLLSDAYRGLWQLLLVAILGGATFILIDLLSTTIGVGLLLSLPLSNGQGLWSLATGLLVILLGVVSTLFLTMAWFVSPAVAVLERPGGTRALGRSRRLARGRGWTVLAVALMVLIPLTVLINITNGSTHHLGEVPLFAIRLLLASILAPLPIVAVTVLYLALRDSSPMPATPDDPAPTGPLAPA
jgi:hypothetical protein